MYGRCRHYLLSWLSTVAPAVLLDLPLCYATQLTTCSRSWYKGWPKTGPLCLTLHVFKTLGPICMIFGMLPVHLLTVFINCITQNVPPGKSQQPSFLLIHFFAYENHCIWFYSILLMPHACKSFTAGQISNMHIICSCLSRLQMSSLFQSFSTSLLSTSSATCPNCFCSTFYAKIPVAVVKSSSDCYRKISE